MVLSDSNSATGVDCRRCEDLGNTRFTRLRATPEALGPPSERKRKGLAAASEAVSLGEAEVHGRYGLWEDAAPAFGVLGELEGHHAGVGNLPALANVV
mmetsp:Transcript_7846/g.20089  ORF Transcript_7846/g.20089 Transcript_7846/m.20089 type:complete len:98 (+) Transcript_7846:75-368(+)